MASFVESLRAVIRFRRPELDPVERRLARAANVGDLRRIARHRLPRGVFDYVDGAAEDELTAARNVAEFSRFEWRPRVLREVGEVDPSREILGVRASIPLVLAPTGFTRIVDPAGELAVAAEAAQAGITYTLSSLATRSIEEVRAVSGGELWFQVYLWRDRGLVAELLERALAARYSAIVITVDTAVLGRRERDVRRGFTLPPALGPSTIVDGLRHPGWTLDFLRNEPIRFANVTGRAVGDGTDPVSLSEYVSAQFDPSLSWSDLAWFRERWPGKVVLKGVQTVDDALIAAREGVDAVALSNHGGRQLDGAPPPVLLVEPVVDAVGGEIEVICDGGIRRGSDIVKAVALGATAGMAGRAYLYGLGAGGARGVRHVLSMLGEDVRRTMALLGCASVAELDRELIRRLPDG
ncbi:MAG: alpha-hydroxy acid oxidase [Acidimicrobiia bacterium]|jgi:L-lactate dehydrogenase (cytochrome)